MSIPSTLVLPEDEERTAVDSRSRSLEATEEPSPSIWPVAGLRVLRWLRSHFPRFVGLPLLVALVVAMSVVFFRERAVSERLRQANAQLSREKHAWNSRAAPGDWQVEPEPKGRPGLDDASSNEPYGLRDELEQRGAALLVANEHRAAIAHYEMMSERFRDEPAFSKLVQILRARVRCRSTAIARDPLCG